MSQCQTLWARNKYLVSVIPVNLSGNSSIFKKWIGRSSSSALTKLLPYQKIEVRSAMPFSISGAILRRKASPAEKIILCYSCFVTNPVRLSRKIWLQQLKTCSSKYPNPLLAKSTPYFRMRNDALAINGDIAYPVLLVTWRRLHVHDEGNNKEIYTTVRLDWGFLFYKKRSRDRLIASLYRILNRKQNSFSWQIKQTSVEYKV